MTGATPTDDSLRAAARISWLSVGWTLIASSIAIVTGITRGSLVLIVFALTGLLDAVGSSALWLHFRHALAHQRISEARERIALRIVGTGLVVVGLFTVVESVRRLVTGSEAERSALGVVIASASIVVLSVLARRKHVIAELVSSNALRADGALSATGAALAVVALLGTGLGSSEDFRWVDPSAALVVALVAAASGLRALREEEAELDK